MNGLNDDISAFRARQREELAQARERAALQLSAGVDLCKALAGTPAERNKLAARLERLIERERQRGMRRHWSYDLNRHISLKQVLDRLRGANQV